MNEGVVAEGAEMAGAVAEAAAPPLREGVLTGRFVGADAARPRLAAFLAGEGDALTDWFGAERAARLAADRDALRGALDRDIAAIDALIGEQLDAILHHARLRRLEGSWRGLHWLVSGADTGPRLRIRMLSVAWPEIVRDLERAPEFDQSNMFRRIYEDEFGMPGGTPYGLLVIDHAVRHRPVREAPTDDVEALAQLGAIAAAAFAPAVVGAAPALLDLDEWNDLAMAADPASPLRDALHAGWRALAGRPDMRFVGVAIPPLLARRPWADDPGRVDGFRYREHAPDDASRVWMSAGYALAAAVARSVGTFNWPADVRGVEADREGGGLVTDLPAEHFSTDPPGVVWRPPVAVVLSDRQERALTDSCFIPLASLPFTPDAGFGSMRTLQAPDRFVGANADAANANAALSAQFHAMLCVSRFAHYVKILGRDMLGSILPAEEVEARLQSWLSRYIDGSRSLGPETRARRPLLAGRVSVVERPDKPGSYGCTMQLQPHFQLEDLAATFRLTTELAPLGRVA